MKKDSSLRDMKTTQELRAIESLKTDSRDSDFENFRFRPRRANIRHAWDDVTRDEKGRTWKNYRRTKWNA